jgi:hypothetical protein
LIQTFKTVEFLLTDKVGDFIRSSERLGHVVDNWMTIEILMNHPVQFGSKAKTHDLMFHFRQSTVSEMEHGKFARNQSIDDLQCLYPKGIEIVQGVDLLNTLVEFGYILDRQSFHKF